MRENHLESLFDASMQTSMHYFLDSVVKIEQPLIDPDFEHNVELVILTDELCRLLAPERSAWHTVYRAINFMSLLTDNVQCNAGLNMSVVTGATDEQAAIRAIEQAAWNYFENHPTIHGFVDAYMPEIDPSGDCGDVAEIVCGLMGYEIEQHWSMQHADEIVQDWYSREV